LLTRCRPSDIFLKGMNLAHKGSYERDSYQKSPPRARCTRHCLTTGFFLSVLVDPTCGAPLRHFWAKWISDSPSKEGVSSTPTPPAAIERCRATCMRSSLTR